MKNPSYGEGKATLQRWCERTAVISVGLLAILAALGKEDATRFSHSASLETTVSWLLDNNWWLALFLAVLAGLARALKEYLERQWIWAAVHAIVLEIQRDAFANQAGLIHHHRATLFQFNNCHWWPWPPRGWWPWGRGRGPCSGWLVPVIRSGYTAQRRGTFFLAPDNLDQSEGVAGHVWASNGEVRHRTPAPLQQSATAQEIADYAAATFISETMARRMLSKNGVLAASFRGVPILGRAGRRWGVLVLDSRSPDALTANINLTPYAYCLGKLLERV